MFSLRRSSRLPNVAFALLAGTGVLAVAWPEGAVAQSASQKVRLDIPAQDLSASLTQFGRETGTEIVFSPEAVREKKAVAVKGEFGRGEALRLLLEGTGLRFRETVEGAIVVEGSERRVEEEGKVELEEVVVTGTHIRGVTPVGAPIRTVDRTEIERSGYTTTEQLLQSLPQNFRSGAAGASADSNLATSTVSGFSASFGSGVNFRGLGNTATLVLVNGHRVASSGSGYFTDISTIPISSIDHIDVLTDGASAVYGSDAIAGVINIVLKKQSQGFEAGLRYGSTTEKGFSSYGGNLQSGYEWTSGGITFGADFSRQNELDVGEKSFTSSIPSPVSIFPSYHQGALNAAAHHAFGDRFELHGDAQYTDRKQTAFSPGFQTTLRIAPETDRGSASIGASYQILNSWTLRYDVSGGKEVVDSTTDTWTDGVTSFDAQNRDELRFTDQNVIATGDLFALPTGSVKLAIGASHRTEDFEQDALQLFSELHTDVERNVNAGFAEIRIPIFSEQKMAPGFRRLTLSAAERYDDYSDFGGTTNPKFGLSWFPIDTLELRAAYSTSFRAPATGIELANSERGTTAVLVRSLPGSDGITPVPVVITLGGRPNLQPETAQNRTFGLDYAPSFSPGLKVSFNYYDISYSGQLADPPFLVTALNDPALAPVVTQFPDSAALRALVDAATNNGAFYLDVTGGEFGPDPLTSAVNLYDIRTQNLSRTDTSGFDLAVSFPFTVGIDQIDTRLDATYIDKFSTRLTSGSSQLSRVDTVGFPARLRLRGQSAWTHGNLNVALAANYVNSYSDTSSIAPRDVGAYTTIDLVARYTFEESAWSGAVVTLAATNVFDRRPPFVESGNTSILGSHYDPANADPRGRFVVFTIGKNW
jgi:outer membrane receptor protein involved in Fe transport